MTTKEIINLDYRKEENKEIIQKVLRQIKPLSKYPDGCDIPFHDLEKAVTVMCKKYKMRVNQLIPDIQANDKSVVWRAWLLNETNLKTIDMVYGISLYEVLAKISIRLYAEIRKGIPTRN